MQKITIERTTAPKAKPTDETKLGFGKIFTDHMFIMNYDEGEGWHNPRIVPYAPIALDPAAMCLHYGQADFEGLKAYRRADGSIGLFRPDQNMARLNVSNDRLCIPKIDEAFGVEAIKTLVEVDKDWVPHSEGTSLYIRPFLYSTNPTLSLHGVYSATFAVILSPSGNYFKNGLKPVPIMVETEDVRAVRGGTGEAKCGGNGTVVTPMLTGSILPGITRKSCIELLRSQGIPVEERLISVDELFAAAKAGTLEEAWCVGTAAVISPIGELAWNGEKYEINGNKIGPLSQMLYDELTGIQRGTRPDPFGWVDRVC